MMKEAKLVVVIVNDTNSIKFEIDKLFELGLVEKALFLVPKCIEFDPDFCDIEEYRVEEKSAFVRRMSVFLSHSPEPTRLSQNTIGLRCNRSGSVVETWDSEGSKISQETYSQLVRKTFNRLTHAATNA